MSCHAPVQDPALTSAEAAAIDLKLAQNGVKLGQRLKTVAADRAAE